MHFFHPSCKVREWLFGALKYDYQENLDMFWSEICSEEASYREH
jgi:hypothetical protein